MLGSATGFEPARYLDHNQAPKAIRLHTTLPGRDLNSTFQIQNLVSYLLDDLGTTDLDQILPQSRLRNLNQLTDPSLALS